MMLDIKKNRGFHKIPASKLQREADNSQQQQQQRGNISQTQQQQQQQQQQKQQHGKAAVKQLNGIQSKQGAAATRSVVASSNGRATATSTTTTTTSNPVRAANQRYFLVSSYKDPSFLKAECDLAHAQVTHKSTPTTTTTTTTQAAKTTTTHKRNKTCDDHKNNNSNSKQLAIAGNIGLNDMRRPTTLNGNQAGGNSSNSTNSSSSNNASRTTTTTTTAIASNTTVHRIDIKYSHSNNSKSTLLASKAATTSSAAATAGATVSGAAIGRVVAGGKLKPLTLQCNNNHNAMNSHNSYNNNINNNSSSSNSNGSSSHNNNSNSMQRQQQQQHDDISYIDSDDTPPATAGAAATTATVAAAAATSSSQKVTTNSICYFKPITPPLQLRNNQQQQSSDKPLAQRSSVRPKSTIISTTNSNFAASYEKFNSYKHTNGERSKERDRDRDRDRDRERENSTARRYGIDSLSIKASIEKFNSLSEQKRQPTPMRHCSSGGNNSGGGGGNAASVAATTAAGSMAATATAAASAAAAAAITVSGGTGSSSNLQQRYCSSSDLENTRIAAGYTSSLTRAAYRTTANSTSSTANGGGTTAATMTTLASVAPISKSANRIAHGLLAKATSSSNTSGGGSATDCAMIAVNNATVAATSSSSSGNNSSSNHKASRNVSSSSRSVLPPVSPTSSRYWDRDSTRSNSNATSSSIGSSSLSTKHNSSVDDGYKSSRDEKFEGTCGLRNIGNTCFMSSVIQCLSHTTELTRFLRQYHTSARSTRSTSKDEQILYEFAKLIQEMWTTNVNSVTPMGLKLAFSTKHRMYSDCSQQDAQEFLRFFLDSLHSALNTGTKGEPLNIDDNLSDNKKADLTWEWYSRNENSLIRDLFVGQLKSTLKCTSCSNTSVTFDPFWDLSVPLPSSSRCKLDACLDLFIREEVLDGDEMPTCSKCKTRRKCTKSLTIQRFPKYLVIHLKRFSETRWSKLSNMVEFPTGDRELNMASYGANPNSNVHYSLYAISNHMGSTVGGHYVAICKHPDSHKWHEFNDNIVSDALSESCLVSPSAYILFYERA